MIETKLKIELINLACQKKKKSGSAFSGEGDNSLSVIETGSRAYAQV